MANVATVSDSSELHLVEVAIGVGEGLISVPAGTGSRTTIGKGSRKAGKGSTIEQTPAPEDDGLKLQFPLLVDD